MSEHSDPHLKEIVDKLDDLFLYLSTVPTILFTVIQVALGEEMLIGFLPILVPTFVALYIGYIRGAIIVNTIEERVRGWMYLIAAILLYPISYCVLYLKTYSSVIQYVGVLLCGIIGFAVGRWFVPFFTNLAWKKQHKIKEINKILDCTFFASLSLLSASQLFSSFIFDCLHNSPGRNIILFPTLFYSILFFIFEFLARRELQSLSNSKRKS